MRYTKFAIALAIALGVSLCLACSSPSSTETAASTPSSTTNGPRDDPAPEHTCDILRRLHDAETQSQFTEMRSLVVELQPEAPEELQDSVAVLLRTWVSYPWVDDVTSAPSTGVGTQVRDASDSVAMEELRTYYFDRCGG